MPTIESSQAQSKTDNDKKRWYKDRRFLLGCGVFIATSLAAVFTFYQAWIARDTAKRQLRAYVIVSSKHIPKLQEGIKPFIESTIDNVGQTPVYDACWISGVNVMEYPLPPEIISKDKKACSNVMNQPDAPKWFFGKATFAEKWRDVPFQASEVKAIQEEKAAVYLVGRVCYLDIFRDVHYTDFCMYWKWENGRLGTAIYCPQGNGADN